MPLQIDQQPKKNEAAPMKINGNVNDRTRIFKRKMWKYFVSGNDDWQEWERG